MKKFLIGLALLVVALTAADARFPRGTPTSPGVTLAFTKIPIGGAGAVIGVSSVPSAGVKLARGDQFGCWLSVNNSSWKNLQRVHAFPQPSLATVGTVGNPEGVGSGACVADPVTGTEIWMENGGAVFVSLDQGNNFSSTCYPAQGGYGSGISPSQQNGMKGLTGLIAIDPNNTSIVYMSTPYNGMYRTLNKGSSCSLISAVGAGTAYGSSGYGNLIAFDTSGGTLSGASCPTGTGGNGTCTKNIFVSTYGTGVYRSTDGGGSWTLLNSAGMPTTHLAAKSDNLGNLWLIDGTYSGGNRGLGYANRWSGGTWNAYTSQPQRASGVDIDYTNCASLGACHVIVTLGGGVGSSGYMYTTVGGGSGTTGTWNVAQTITTVSSDVPWIANLINGGFGQYPNTAAFDSSGNVYTGGEGVFWYTPATSGSSVTWNSQTSGLEESLASSFATSPTTSGYLNIATWDLNCFIRLQQPFASNPGNSNRGCYSTNAPNLQHSYMIDWASANTDFFVATSDNQVFGPYCGVNCGNEDYSGKSSDGGVTWSAMPKPPRYSQFGYIGQTIAASSNQNWIWSAVDGAGGFIPPYYTTNGGTTYDNIVLANFVDTLVTTASTPANTGVLTFTSTTGVVDGDTVSNTSAPSTVQSGSVVVSHTSTTVTLDKPVTGAGVASGNTINFAHSGGGSTNINTSASTASGDLTFASVPSWISSNTLNVGVYNKTTTGSLTRGGNGNIVVTAVTGNKVTLSAPPDATVNSGDTILFSRDGWNAAVFVQAHTMAADRVTANKFYIFNWRLNAIIACTSGGASCTNVGTPTFGANSQYGGQIKTVPSNANHLFAADAGSSPVDGVTGFLSFSSNGGAAWTNVTNMFSVRSFGFGAPAPGRSYPTIVVNGYYTGQGWGIYQSIDWDTTKTWTKIGDYPLDLALFIEDIDGDKVIPNVFYYTTNAGVFCSAASLSYCARGTVNLNN